ncbi:MAG: hypothetical protein GC149_11675 [Gammaproteobacteria bacterium]|nr:hypothetical protein [Gammaproteobacteria bacterium]
MQLFTVSRVACAGILCVTPLAAQAAGNAVSSAFNPAISVILSGTYAQFSNDPANYTIPGFALGDGVGPGDRGFGLGESELSIAANIDDQFYGRFTTSFDANNNVSVEEAFLETVGLGQGITIKGGRFLSGIGYLNNKHSHTWDFVDQPLVYRAMLADQLKDDGVQVRWLAPTDMYMEFGAEALRGKNFPAGGDANQGRGTTTVFVHFGDDFNESNSWSAGLSFVDAKANDRITYPGAETFTGSSKLGILSFVWKWAPNGNMLQHNFTLQSEYFRRSEDGTYQASAYDANQSGYYVQGVYQFMQRWRVGLRYDHLHAEDPGAAFAGTALATQGHDPHRWSTMVDFSRTEFSRLRVQYNQDDSGPQTDHQWYFQYIMAMGAHGAHGY